jgi:hypothetical protein
VRQLTRVPAASRPVADVGYSRPAPPPKPAADLPPCDGASQPCSPAALVRIYDLAREWDAAFWLCPAGAREMTAGGWRVRKHRAPPFGDLTCYVHRDGGCAP